MEETRPEVVGELVEGDLAVAAVDEEAAEVLLHPFDGDPRGPGGGGGAGPGRGREAQADADPDPDPERRHHHALPLHGGRAACCSPAGGGDRHDTIQRRRRWRRRLKLRGPAGAGHGREDGREEAGVAWAAGSEQRVVVWVAEWRAGEVAEGGGRGAQVPGLCSLPLLASRSFAALSVSSSPPRLCSGTQGRQCNGAPARGLRTWCVI